MRKAHLLICLANVVLVSLFAQTVLAKDPPEPPAQEPETGKVQWNYDITLGDVLRDITNRHSSRFQYGRDVPQGFYLENFLFTAETPGNPWRFTLSGQDAGERDQHFRLTYDRFGKYRLDVRWDQFSLFVADNIQTLHVATSKGVLEVPDLIQARFESATDGELLTLVPELLSATPFGRLELLRRKVEVRQEYRPHRNWRLRFDVSNELRSGNRRMTVGAYDRTNTPLGDTFFTPGIEVPEPIDYRTTEITAGVSYEAERGFFRADYRGSFFRNRTSTLTVDNPFRLTDELASRFRFGRTQIDLYPDNDVHTFSFLGGYSFELWNTRLTGALDFSFWEQDDPFLPFTLNTSIVANPGDLPAGTTPTDLAALPQNSLNGDATVISTDVALTTRPAENVRVAVRYNAYDWDDDRDEILFPGYAALGDSAWRTIHHGHLIENPLHDYLRQRSSTEVVWKPRKEFAWKNEFAWEGWNRQNREISRTNEWMWKTQLILKTNKWFYAKLNYHYGDRIPRGPYDPIKEFVLLRKFDQAHRIHHRADVMFQVNPNDQFNLSGSYAYRSDRYDERLYGLTINLNGFFVVDANYIPNDRFAGYVNFTRDRTRSTSNVVGKTGAVNYNIPNTFIRDINDRVNSLGTGFDLNFLDYRLNWNVSYAFALSEIQIDTTNPFTVDVEATTSATAYPLPDIEENFHEVRTTISYQMRPNVQVGVRYLFEPRSLTDFTTDQFGTGYIAATAAPENNLSRYLFINARDSSYHAHAAAFFLKYSF